MRKKRDVEDGNFTRIHNDIWEALARAQLTATEFRCLMFLFRETYGWRRKETTMSMKKWADGVGVQRRNVIRAVQHMLDCHVITRTDNGSHRPATWGFNKYFEEWDFAETSVNSDTATSVRIDTSLDATSVNSDTTTSVNSDTQYKERKKEEEKERENTPFVAAQPRVPREKIKADEYTLKAKRMGLQPAQFRLNVDALLDIIGKRALVDADPDDRDGIYILDDAKQAVLTLGLLGYGTPDMLKDLAETWRVANAWRGTAPTLRQLKEQASACAVQLQPKEPEFGYIVDPLTGVRKQVQL